MEIKLQYEPVSKQEIARYAKDTLVLMKQNIWLTFKLVVLGMIGASVVGLLILSPDIFVTQILGVNGNNAIISALYETISDCIWVIFTIAPFWLILFFTGFRLMENRQAGVPFLQVIRWNVNIIRSFWSVKFIVIVLGILLVINMLFMGDHGQESSSNKELAESLTSNGQIALVFYAMASNGMAFGLGIYWFSFVPLLMYQALLHGHQILPTINKATSMAISSEKTPFTRIVVFVLFMLVDISISLIATAIVFYFSNTLGIIAATFLRGLAYVFIAGMLYNYCVDKIEGRKIKKKVSEKAFNGIHVPSPA